MRRAQAIAAGVLLAVGTAALAYPYAAQWQEQLNQSRANAELADAVTTAGPYAQDELRAEAEAYNAALFTGRVAVGDEQYDGTMLLDGTDVIARLRVPSIDLDQPVRHTMEESALLAGVGHGEGSSLPVGGESTHAVLGGHRGLAEAVGFTHLPAVKVGDNVYVESLGKTMTYRVVKTEVLEPDAAAVHPIEPGRDLVTLITCTPMGVNSHRWVATAERVLPGDETPPGQPSDLPGFPWWAVGAAAGLAASVVVPVVLIRRGRARRERRTEGKGRPGAGHLAADALPPLSGSGRYATAQEETS